MSSGAGTIYLRGDIYWIQYSHRGRRCRESSRSRLLEDARSLLRRRLGELAGGRSGRDAERVTFDDLVEGILLDYEVHERRSIDRVKLSIAHLRKHFGSHRAVDIDADAARRYIVRRRGEGAAPQTAKNELTALKRMLNLAHQAGKILHVPHIPLPKVDNVREGFFTAAELERVIAELSAPVVPVVRFAWLTGWRKGEILPLQWRAVDWDRRVVRLAPGTTKNSEGREFPFGPFPALAELLQDQLALTRAVEREKGLITPWVFHRDGRQIRTIRKAWEGACRRAGLEGRWFHDLRRSAVQNLERAGVPRSVGMRLTGHKTESVYLRYAIAAQTELEEGVQKLAGMHHRPFHDARQTVIPLVRDGTSG